MSRLLEVENLRVRFRTMAFLNALTKGVRDPFIDAVCDVSFSIGEGETLALVGESGSGKTTLGRAIVGLVPMAEGRVRFRGEELSGSSERAFRRARREIAMMFQDPVGSLSPRLTVGSAVVEPFRIHGMTKDRDLRAEAERLLTMVGLPADFALRYPHQLSGGQARRVGVARALALSPKLVIADEPTAGLDVSVQGEILNLLGRLQKETDISILIITHNLNVVRHVSDRTAIMYLGRFVEQGPTETIFHDPHHPYTEALISANPEPDPDAQLTRVELKGEIPSLMRRPKGCEFHTRCIYAQKDKCYDVPPGVSEAERAHTYTCHYPVPIWRENTVET